MGIISKEAINEMQLLAKNKKIKKDFEMLEKNRKVILKNFSIEDFFKFLNFFNKIIGNKKNFEKMEGKNFKL
jgi:hypothetical protein